MIDPGDTGLVDVGPPGAHDAVDRHPAPGAQGDDLPRAHLVQGDLGYLVSVRPGHHPCGLRQKGHEVGQGVAPPVHRQVLEDLGAQGEDGHGQSRHPLTDRCRRDDGQEHRQLHAHAPLAQVSDRLDDERPAAHQQGRGPDGAHRPTGRAGGPRDPGAQDRQTHHRDAQDVGPLDPVDEPLSRARLGGAAGTGEVVGLIDGQCRRRGRRGRGGRVRVGGGRMSRHAGTPRKGDGKGPTEQAGERHPGIYRSVKGCNSVCED